MGLETRLGSSPVQVEGSNLSIVPLIVREVEEVWGRLLFPCLPRREDTLEDFYALWMDLSPPQAAKFMRKKAL